MPKTGRDINILLGIFGTGGFAREVLPIARQSLSSRSPTDTKHNRIMFVESDPVESQINDVAVVSEAEFFNTECRERHFNIAIGDSKIRQSVALTCTESGASPFSIHAASAEIYDDNEIAEGAIICANSIITSNAKIGRYFHSNIYAYVAHDCVVGDFVTFAPRVNCNGNVHIGDHAYIGTAATLRQGTPEKPLVIGEGAVVGMGAVVTKDVPAFTTVIGNPAKPLAKK